MPPVPAWARISVNADDAAQLLGMPRSTFDDLWRSDQIPSAVVRNPSKRKHRACRVFLVSDLAAFIVARRVQPNGDGER